MGDGTIYPELPRWSMQFIGTSCLGVGDSKRRKSSSLTINNYLLKHHGGTIVCTIYIYIYRERERGRERIYLEIVLYFRDIKMRYLAGAEFLLLNFSVSEAFASKVLVLGEILFLFSCLRYGYRISSPFYPLNMCFHWGFPWEQTFPIEKPIKDQFVFFYKF